MFFYTISVYLHLISFDDLAKNLRLNKNALCVLSPVGLTFVRNTGVTDRMLWDAKRAHQSSFAADGTIIPM
tara:strand:- start:532 stop:744 length:213 start_codon:yes stop_codon:yes gene_type:complete